MVWGRFIVIFYLFFGHWSLDRDRLEYNELYFECKRPTPSPVTCQIKDNCDSVSLDWGANKDQSTLACHSTRTFFP